MIPKVIHYCWLSGDPYPEIIQRCIDSWKDKLPDYQFVLWDKNKFDINSHIWVKQAYESRKFAFAADYIRLYALYYYGGIYLDTDVEVLTSFDNLLNRNYFIGLDSQSKLEAAIIGSEAKSDWILACLKYYDNRKFYGDKNISVADFSKLGFFQIFEKIKNRDELMEYVPESLVKLYWYDKEHDGELIETLQAYLDCDKSANKAAEKLYVNYRTLSGRLKIIRDISGIDFKNSAEMLAVRNGIVLFKMAETL